MRSVLVRMSLFLCGTSSLSQHPVIHFDSKVLNIQITSAFLMCTCSYLLVRTHYISILRLTRPITSGMTFGMAKKNFDEIDRSGFGSFVKKNFDEIDRSGFGSFVKKNFDEIDNAGFGGL